MFGMIEVIGNIWMPNTLCAQTYPLSDYDIDNMRGEDGKIARCDIEDWLNTHSGDFSSITDFSARINNANYGWKNPESEFEFSGMMFGNDE